MATTPEISAQTAPETLIDHNLTDAPMDAGVLYEMKPAKTPGGNEIPGLFNAWITLNNPAQFNSYTTAWGAGCARHRNKTPDQYGKHHNRPPQPEPGLHLAHPG